MPRFLLIGGATVDFYAYTPRLQEIDINAQAKQQLVCIPFGSKTELNDLRVHPGGSAANSAVALRRLGSPAQLVAAIGADAMGKVITDDLKRRGVDCKLVQPIKGQKTGLSIVLLLPSGEKSLLTYRGANDCLAPVNLPASVVSHSDVVLFTSLPSKENCRLFCKALEFAEKQNKHTVFAPSISMLVARKKELSRMHERFDVAIMNSEEARVYTGSKNLKQAIKNLPGRVRVITDAANGAYACVSGRFMHIPAADVKVVDSTGAGDSFTAAFTHYYFINQTKHPEDEYNKVARALRLASAVAGIKLEREGAHFLKKNADVQSFLKKHTELKNVKEI